MADDQEGTNDVAEEGGVADYDGNDANDGIDTADLIETTTTTPPAPNIDDGANSVAEDYADDEPIPDFIVKLRINGGTEDAATDIVNAVITDEFGNVITTTPWRNVIDGYTTAITQEIQDGISGNGTDIGGKSWWGKSIEQKYRTKKRERAKKPNREFQVCVSRCASMKQQR
jgi:hypothetical protein